jgi:hypothetical protein
MKRKKRKKVCPEKKKRQPPETTRPVRQKINRKGTRKKSKEKNTNAFRCQLNTE